jgi:hypothetical protein
MSFILQPVTSASGSITAAASGAITKGAAVSINAAGTVSQTGITGYSIGTFTSGVLIGTSGTNGGCQLAFDPVNNKYLLVYCQVTTNYVMGCVGTLSGTTMTWGTPVVLTSNVSSAPLAVFTTAGKFVVFRTGSTYSAAVVTISGTTPTAGTFTTIETSTFNSTLGCACYDSINDKVFISYPAGLSNTIKSYVGTVSGTSISFGTSVQIGGTYSGSQPFSCCVFNPATGKIVFQKSESGAGSTFYLGTISGTSISYGGSPLGPIGTNYAYCSGVYESQYSKVVMTVGNTGIYIIGSTGANPTNDGSTTTSSMNFAQGSGAYPAFAYDSTSQIIYMTGNPSSSGASSFVFSKVQLASATSISVSSSSTITSVTNATLNNICNTSIVFDSTNSKLVVAYASLTINNAYSQVGYGDVSNYADFIGFSVSAYTNGQIATVNTIGNSDANQSGLTPASKYYVQTNGSLSTTPAATSVYAGTAISATNILIKGQP